MRSLPATVRSFARELRRDFAKAYERDHARFRKRLITLLRKNIPGSASGPKRIRQVTRARELFDEHKLRCQQRKLPFDPHNAWKEIYPMLHVPRSGRLLLRNRVRSRRGAERRRKSRRGILGPKTPVADIPSITRSPELLSLGPERTDPPLGR